MVFKCKMCGGDIIPTEGKNIVQCSYCKSIMTLPDLENEKIVNLYNRANDFRLSNEFDKAYGVYETILEIDNKQVEAHWGLLLCKYGVEYIDDPKTGTKIPTCHRTMTTSILKDNEFKIIKENSYGEALELYTKEAKNIDEIQKGILEVSTKEEPYDIFICYKETDANGERTHDSVIAQDIYDKLTCNNYKVFFARITLENKLGSEYEPYIYSALNSSKVMLVVGTSEENFNAVWVKNEWSRYLEMMKEDKSKILIPVFSKVDAYKLPDEFARFQAQSMDKIGAMQDLIHGIQKVIDETKDKKITDVDVEKVKKAMEEAANLGNGRYEVIVMKEKAFSWYKILVVAFAAVMCFYIMLSIDGRNVLSSIYSLQNITSGKFKSQISAIPGMLHIVSSMFAVISCMMVFLGRKIYRKSKIVMYIAILLDIFAFGIYGIYGFSSIVLIQSLIQYAFLLIDPKWYIDSSLKLIVDKDGKDKIQADNEKIVKNFKEKDEKIIKKKHYIVLLLIILFVAIVDLYYILASNSNKRNDQINQVEVSQEIDTVIYTDKNLQIPIGVARKGEYYDIIEESVDEQSYIIYKIRTKKGMQGYVSSSYVQKIYGKNDPLYGKTQTNDKNENVLQIRVKEDYSYIRANATQNSNNIAKVYKDEIYTVIGEIDSVWISGQYGEDVHLYKIRTTFGQEGYILEEDVERLGPKVRDTSKLQIKITAEYVEIKSEIKNGDIIGKVYKDEIYTVLSEDSVRSGIVDVEPIRYYRIRTASGIEGYVPERYVVGKYTPATYYVERLEATN